MQGIKIEFYDAQYTLVATASNTFADVGEQWVQKTVEGDAPIDAPVKPSSEMGVSITRSPPNSLNRFLVCP